MQKSVSYECQRLKHLFPFVQVQVSLGNTILTVIF